jgi:lysophospholipase L1-like esterase
MKASKNTILFFSAFIVAIAILEIFLRFSHFLGVGLSFTQPDSLLGYGLVPNKHYWIKRENDHPIVGKINKYGWRDKDWSIQKPKNTFRIAVLGDSFVEALQVEQEYTFLYLLENTLNKEFSCKVELMNFGRSGFTQSEELLVLKHYVSAFAPDMVLLFFFPGNDITDISKDTTSDRMRPFYTNSNEGELILDTSFSNTTQYKIKCLVNFFKQHSMLVSYFCDIYNRYKINRLTQNGSLEGLDATYSLCTSHPSEIYIKNYLLNKALIYDMSRYCKDRTIDFMLVCLDLPTYKIAIEEKYKKLYPSFNSFFFEDDLRAFSSSINIEYTGLQRAFRKAYENNKVAFHFGNDDGHYNYKGHRLVAKTLLPKLKSMLYDKSALDNRN